MPAQLCTGVMKGSLSLSEDKDVSKYIKTTLQSNTDTGVVGIEQKGEQQEVVCYDDAESEGYLSTAAIYDEVASDIYTSDGELGSFLGRPVEIAFGTFPVGSNYSALTFSPWALFFNKPEITKKISNYSYVQCKLKIKVVVNSTPFIYGMFGLSYQPLVNLNNISSNSNDAMCLSQRPTIWIETHKSKGGEMELPFFHYKNWLQLNNFSDVSNFGKLTLWQLVQAKAANGGLTTEPSFTVYAWAEDVKLCGNTIQAVLQSKVSEGRPAETTNDEYGKGPVSSIATAVGGVAGSLKSVPIIGPFAKATEIGASIIGSIAAIFGFTNVPVIDNVAPYKSMPFHGFASSEIGNVVDKLTLDPKNELCIAPGTVGLPDVDELAIQHLVAKEAIINTVEWAQAYNAGTSLLRMQVTPTICNITSQTNQDILLDTPLGLVARTCSNWRGDIIVRMRVVASKYHRGRLRVSYDPQGDIFADGSSTTVVQTKIIDISDETDIQFRIPYMAPTSWLRTRGTLAEDYDVLTDASALVYDDDFHNGRFQIRVLNALSAPTDVAPATLVISVSGADNFEISNPSDMSFGGEFPSPYTVQSKSASGAIDPQTGSEVVTMVMGTSTPPPSSRYLVNMGEQFQSLRTLMRRTCLVNNELALRTGASSNSTSFYKMVMTKYPPSFGYDPNGIHEAEGLDVPASDYKFNFTTVSPYTWLAPCFVGQRGSMMWHFNADFPDGVGSVKCRRITETDVDTFAELRMIKTLYANGNIYDTARNSIVRSGPGVSGQSLVNQRTQAALSVLMPQYSKYRFVSASPDNAVFGMDEDDTENEKFTLELTVPASTANVPCTYERYCSIGTDFTFFYFLNVPPRYVYTNPTATGA